MTGRKAQRWWMSAGLPLAWALLLGGCRPPCDDAPFLGGRVVATKQDGSPVMPWSEIAGIGSAMTFRPELGEHGHLLQPVENGTTASIAPADHDWSATPTRTTYDKELNKMGCGQITAQVEATGEHTPLGLKKGLNYLVVWMDWRRHVSLRWSGFLPKVSLGSWDGFHMAAVNESSRKTYDTPKYTAHWAFTSTGAIDSTKDKLSPSALQCTDESLKACFVDSPDVWKAETPTPTPSGTGFPMPPVLYSSQPWTACVLFGCCCGGSQCHT